MHPTDKQIRKTITRLLAQREPDATICPSEAARALQPDDWRALMPRLRAVAVAMAQEGVVQIRQRGHVVPPGGQLRGPIRLGRPAPDVAGHPVTPDGRYFVVRGRLWRTSNPHLLADVREALVRQLMDARRAMNRPMPVEQRLAVRAQVDQAKRALGERGPVWWTDGAPDFNRRLAKNTPYADWFAKLSADSPASKKSGS